MERAKSLLEDFELGLFNKVGHANFCARCLSGLPATMAEADPSRMAVGFYCLGALDILGLLETKVKESDREAWSSWIWAQQIKRPPSDLVKESAAPDRGGIKERWIGGFRPGPFMHVEFGKGESTPGEESQSVVSRAHEEADPPHLIMTYTALLSLAILRDDFTQLDRKGLLNLLRATQKPDGSFTSFPCQGESDIRMVYTAFAISAMLDDWSGVDVPRALDFAKRCMSYEGGFGQVPGNEAQGGSTYCALATLALAPEEYRKEATLSAQERKRSERWLVQQQKPRRIFLRYESESGSSSEDELESSLDANRRGIDRPRGRGGMNEKKKEEEILEEEGGGFSGRTGKAEDACYSFWCGAALRILRSGLVGGRGEEQHLQGGEGVGEEDNDDDDFIDRLTHARFLSRCQFRLGGLAKAPGAHPDPYHTYLAIAALALYPPPQIPSSTPTPPSSLHSQHQHQNQNPNPNQGSDKGVTATERSDDAVLLEEVKVERRKKERESWRIAQLDPLINASVETSRWARERIPAGRTAPRKG